MATLHGKTVTDSYAQEFRRSQQVPRLRIHGEDMHRVKHATEEPCGCMAQHGEYHHLTCGMEVCPSCSFPLETCDCLNEG